jgi:hypothetical protein
MMPIRPENRDKYPPDWRKISQRIRVERAQGRCECTGECGRDHGGGRCPRQAGTDLPTGGRIVLTVAHLNHDPSDCSNENLRALCQRCHLQLDREQHPATARATRRARLREAGQLELPEAFR